MPLTTQQLESTTKMQKLTPLQQKIQAKYANDEKTKNQLLSQLFQTANVNPLAGCFPALVQIPIFISLYRALQNLIAENKLDEPFLWIPDLEGPVYTSPPGESLNWIQSIASGTPLLGWENTLAFLTLPVILFVSQTISQKVLQPPKDPNRVLTEQEQVSQGIVNNLPFIVAFFSLNVPAGLGVYWIVNNILTTIITLVVKNRFKDDQLPAEVSRMMIMIENDTTGSVMRERVAAQESAAAMELRGATNSFLDDRPKPGGFAAPKAVVDTVLVTEQEVSATEKSAPESESASEDGEESDADADGTDDGKGKRRKRVKAAGKKRRG